ncbi:MAG: LysR family transcriptional regulator [Sandaracinus sp.]|nr:LysR family transcriptional regulator [Sandaracinus sp.]MCB9613187.1 LysR family transcriptional regulator [Sandaracinus sp.]
MDRVTSLRVFRAVVEEGAFAGAARRLGLSTSMVSKHVAALESDLATRLLHRTTRSLGLTPEGQVFLARSSAILDELDELERELREGRDTPRGLLRITAPVSYGIARVAPVLPAFLDAHPDVRVDLSLTDRVVDVVDEGVDVAIRVVRSLADSTLIAQRLAPMPRVLVGAPSYFERHGRPQTPAELGQHACLRYTGLRDPDTWTFAGPDGEVSVRVDGRLTLDNSLALRDAAVAGTGLLLTPLFVVDDLLQNGSLASCLDAWVPETAAVYGVYPARRHLSPKLRAFLAFAKLHLR